MSRTAASALTAAPANASVVTVAASRRADCPGPVTVRALAFPVVGAFLSLSALGPSPAWADAPAPQSLAAPATATAAGWQVEAGLLAALPAALGTGLSTGVAAGATRRGSVDWGVRAAFSQATEYALAWAVKHSELRLRAAGMLQRDLGGGSVGLRFAAGVTLLYESRLRAQAARLGDAGVALNQTAWSALPGAELVLVLALPIVEPFGLTLGVGPTIHLNGSALAPGWLAQLGAAWWP